jgi:hypothetical protein
MDTAAGERAAAGLPGADAAAATLAAALASEAAALRSCSLSRGGFRQVQLDLYALHAPAARAVAGAAGGRAALAAADGVLVAAAERCADGPALLDPATLDRLAAAAPL